MCNYIFIFFMDLKSGPRNSILPAHYLPYDAACVTAVIYPLDLEKFIFSMIVSNIG